MLLIFPFIFSTWYADFKVQDAEEMRDLNLNITATPALFGYDETEGNKLWPEYSYPLWKTPKAAKNRKIYIDYKNNKLHLDWKKGEKGYYILGPVNNMTVANPNELKRHWKVR